MICQKSDLEEETRCDSSCHTDVCSTTAILDTPNIRNDATVIEMKRINDEFATRLWADISTCGLACIRKYFFLQRQAHEPWLIDDSTCLHFDCAIIATYINFYTRMKISSLLIFTHHHKLM